MHIGLLSPKHELSLQLKRKQIPVQNLYSTQKRIKYSESSPVPFCDTTKDIIIIAYQAQPNALERITALLGELKV